MGFSLATGAASTATTKRLLLFPGATHVPALLDPGESPGGTFKAANAASSTTPMPTASLSLNCQFFMFLFWRSWVALVGFRRERGLMLFFPFLKFRGMVELVLGEAFEECLDAIEVPQSVAHQDN